MERARRPHVRGGQPEQPVGQDRLRPEEVRDRRLAVERPAEERREGEGQDPGRHDHVAPHPGQARLERLRGEGGPGEAVRPLAGDEDHEPGRGADEDRVHEHLEDAVEPLADRVVGAGGGVDHRRGAEAGLVAEEPPRDAVAEGLHDARPGEAAHRGVAGEGGAKHHLDDRGELLGVGDEDDGRAQQVGQAHEGDEELGDVRDARDAAEDHDGGEDDDRDPAHVGGDAEGGLDRLGDAVGLDHVADAEGGEGGEEGEHGAEPGRPEAVLEDVHRPAAPRPLVVLLAVGDGEDDLGELRAHAEEAGDDQPEEGPRAADRDGGRDAGDVPDADGRGEGGRHRLEGRHRARRVGLREDLAQDLPERLPEPPELHAAGEDREVEAGAHEEGHRHRPPHPAVERGVRLQQLLDHAPTSVIRGAPAAPGRPSSRRRAGRAGRRGVRREAWSLPQAGTSIVPSRYFTQWPAIDTRSPRSSHHSSPPRAETWRAKSLAFPRRFAQYGTSVQWAEPVTGSSGMPTGARRTGRRSRSRGRARWRSPPCGRGRRPPPCPASRPAPRPRPRRRPGSRGRRGRPSAGRRAPERGPRGSRPPARAGGTGSRGRAFRRRRSRAAARSSTGSSPRSAPSRARGRRPTPRRASRGRTGRPRPPASSTGCGSRRHPPRRRRSRRGCSRWRWPGACGRRASARAGPPPRGCRRRPGSRMRRPGRGAASCSGSWHPESGPVGGPSVRLPSCRARRPRKAPGDGRPLAATPHDGASRRLTTTGAPRDDRQWPHARDPAVPRLGRGGGPVRPLRRADRAPAGARRLPLGPRADPRDGQADDDRGGLRGRPRDRRGRRRRAAGRARRPAAAGRLPRRDRRGAGAFRADKPVSPTSLYTFSKSLRTT